MVNNYIKRCIMKSAALSGVYNITKKLKKGATLFFYHGVVKKIINPVVQETHIQMDQFEKQMLYLKKNCEVISLDYLYECITKGYKIYNSQVLLTFDDGYKNNLYDVAPFLKMLNMPLTVFVSTRYINSSDDLRLPYYYLRAAIFYTEKKSMYIPSIKMNIDISSKEKRISVIKNISEILKTVPQKTVNQIVDDLIKLLSHDRWSELNNLFSSDEIMNWDEVKKLHDSGVTIGAHCHDHAILHSNQSKAEIDYQLITSKDLIEKHLGECKYFSYPNGRMSDITLDSIMSVKSNKYLLGFTTVPGEIENDEMNRFVLPRIFPRKDLDGFKFILNTCFRYNSNYYKWCSNF